MLRTTRIQIIPYQVAGVVDFGGNRLGCSGKIEQCLKGEIRAKPEATVKSTPKGPP